MTVEEIMKLTPMNGNPILTKLNKLTEEVYNHFKTELYNKNIHPIELIKKYNPVFDEIDFEFKKNILLNPKAKTGMFVRQCNKYGFHDYIVDKLGFSHTRGHLYIPYSRDYFLKLTLFEVFLLLNKYDFLYPFMIRFAMYKVLTGYFKFYSKTDQGQSLLLGLDDLTLIFDEILAYKKEDFEVYSGEMDLKIMKRKEDIKMKKESRIIPDLGRPESAEDLTMMFEGKGYLTQREKYKIVMEVYNVSERTAQNWFMKFGLCKNKYNKKDDIATQENPEVVRLRDEIRMLKEEIEKRDNRISELETELDKYKPKLMGNNDSSGLNFFKIDENLNF